MRSLAAALITVAVVSSSASADGDPASDVLLGQDVFLPYSSISQHAERDLYATTTAAHQAGYPIKVALIAAPSDLGVVPSLFGRPVEYARFLSSELAGPVDIPVLVVMPGGFGLAAHGSALNLAPVVGLGIGRGTDGLAAAAIAATRRLAAAAGHPLPISGVGSGPSAGAGPGTIHRALIAIIAMVLFGGAVVTGAATVRARAGSVNPRSDAESYGAGQ